MFAASAASIRTWEWHQIDHRRESVTSWDETRIVVGKANWRPLEMLLSALECEDYMHMGCAGDIELYKHRRTRRYLNISSEGRCFNRLADGTYVEIAKDEAIRQVCS